MINLCRSPKFSDITEKKPNPGPGYYKPSSIYRKGSSFSFSQSDRSVSLLTAHDFEDLPGPGTYSPTQKGVNHSMFAFNSNSPRFQGEKERSPGPGTYLIEDQPKNKPSLKTVHRITIHPAPVPVSIPLLERQEVSRYDGQVLKASPAEYYPKLSQTKPNLGVILFGKSKHERNLWDKTNPFTKIPSRENVGPGKYAAEKEKEKSKLSERDFSSKSPRFKVADSNLPGPGYYDPNIEVVKPSSHSVIANKSQRNIDYGPKREGVEPKPTKFKAKPRQPSPIFKSGTARECIKPITRTQIGPGTYEVEIGGSSLSSYSFSMESRFKSINSRHESPGPGTYNAPKAKKQASPMNWKSPRFQPTSDQYIHVVGDTKTPGPGNYTSFSPWSSQRNQAAPFGSKTLRVAEFLDGAEENPDPGIYRTAESSRKRGATIGSEVRFKGGIGSYIKETQYGNQVGPGSYSPKRSLSKRTHNISWLN
ncbi:unnamed protein product [Blepharisma stoltei]|uniref:Sperm-tail PG-rich repeat-containing protein 2 n=1 Tax=Blepharisma stoltei TaxID=1481888 RepID=A0AAU9JEK1_9CILI|nr:unnamed protein product [Blepharisma stoltei]